MSHVWTIQSAILSNEENWVELRAHLLTEYISVIIYEITLQRVKMADEFVVASEKYGSGSLERKYKFSEENGNLERIGRKREITSSFKQFFKVTMRHFLS